ncbi:hypothetical protein DD237_005288 [Peronospora effusa]|uniref:Uncharacterized protein n=1 Tax=Peronospora effusa TaxID=542832 RepID=A0A3R7YQM5_9STRA|nr:hypothetical protein DD237_005288 [Peronospora effusa]
MQASSDPITASTTSRIGLPNRVVPHPLKSDRSYQSLSPEVHAARASEDTHGGVTPPIPYQRLWQALHHIRESGTSSKAACDLQAHFSDTALLTGIPSREKLIIYIVVHFADILHTCTIGGCGTTCSTASN